jgi:hypothetical protein
VSKGGCAGEFEAVLEPEAGKSADCARDNRPHDEIFLISLKESDRMVTLKISTKNIRALLRSFRQNNKHIRTFLFY